MIKLRQGWYFCKDPSLTDADDGVPPEIIAQEIVEELSAALAEFSAVADALVARAAEVAHRAEPGNFNHCQR
ncbi:hypothetical protein ACFWPX_03000 [Nocardia sp. NPDC058518]|uniref:hypothetical protein n=1 Tax=Nocardia sp. NPDC058518 TaxID=3346534 RepID=UPI00365949C5